MYWTTSGPSCTAQTVEIALNAARERHIDHIVVASASGETARLFAGKIANAVCVTHAFGFSGPGKNEMTEEMRRELRGANIQVITASHVLSGAERGISRKFTGAYPVEIMAHTLRMLGQGVKVCVEIAVMALDAGAIPFGQDVIAVAGSSSGADTAVIIRPHHASQILDTKICEILCKPDLRQDK